jgi:NADH-quinone oxidoreductase subunit L
MSSFLHILADYSCTCQILILIAVLVKCCAMGIHHWLPDAMEGPTQVSALIHAATLVIAGVITASKFTPLISWLPFCCITIAAAGVTTYSLMSMCCYDSKRLVAYSTG